MPTNHRALLRILLGHLLITLCLGSSLSMAKSYKTHKLPLIEVVGQGEVQAQPNEAELSLTFTETKLQLEDAREIVDDQVASLLKVIKRFDLATSSLDTSQVNIHPRYDYQKNGQRNFLGYQINRRVSFTLVNLKQLDKLVKAISKEQIAQLDHVRFTHSNPEKLEQEALDLAIQNSKTLAQHIAESYDAKIGKIHRVNYQAQHSSPAPRVMAMSAEMSRGVDNTYQQKDLIFRASVQASFTIE